MLSAISFGVFCRSAPSIRPIIRSRKVEPGRGGDAHHDPVGEHLRAAGDGRAVAAGFADHRGGFAGDRRLVDRGDALDHLAVGGDEVAGLDEHHVARAEARARAPPRDASRSSGSRRRFATMSVRVALQARRLGLAAALGHGLGEVGEEQREPEPEDDLEAEAEVAGAGRRGRAGRGRW